MMRVERNALQSGAMVVVYYNMGDGEETLVGYFREFSIKIIEGLEPLAFLLVDGIDEGPTGVNLDFVSRVVPAS
ncbi:hypothetical protein ACP26L_36465 (plasmid) [Paenibacillus sp. S-38]|uniref:hypothetical protein n=1 Tax=Paenibacillus sp. S-38 TaxID=3416710 RepID=UPI003CF5C007